VQSKGGILRVAQNDAGELLLAGQVKLVFEGNLTLET
jgi:diaminopimelate epimerase